MELVVLMCVWSNIEINILHVTPTFETKRSDVGNW